MIITIIIITTTIILRTFTFTRFIKKDACIRAWPAASDTETVAFVNDHTYIRVRTIYTYTYNIS